MVRVRIAVGLLLLASAPARVCADEPSWTLDWDAPVPPCPARLNVMLGVERWLEQSSERSYPRGVKVVARVHQLSEQFVLDLHLTTPSGVAHERHFSERCETLANVIALKVALVADPGAWFDKPKSHKQATAPAVPDVRFWPRLAASFTSGVLRGPAPFLALTGVVRFPTLAFEIGVAYGFPVREHTETDEHVDFSVLLANVRVCAQPQLGPVEFSLCAGADIGSMHAVGIDTETFTESTQLYAAVVLAPAARMRVAGPLYAWLGVDGFVTVFRPMFAVDSDESRWKAPMVGARVMLGAELHFD